MWTYILLALFVGTFVALLVVVNALSRRIGDLERQRVAIQIEEERVFDFLHSLGEAFSEGVRSSELHRLIVESAVRILDAHGGVLYLVDRAGNALVPAFISKGCPPLVEIPQHILDQAVTSPVAVDSYMRLHTVHPGEGVIGHCWNLGEARVFDSKELAALGCVGGAASALVGPLVYRRKILGMLGLATGPMSIRPFTSEDLKVFKTTIEQGAFALYNEVVYSEAAEKKRLDHDLEIAREIQRILLPSSPPTVQGYDISGINVPARHVSGDYFDYIQISPGRIGVAIADVSGKGVPASLIMAMCRSVLRSAAAGCQSAAEVLMRVNAQLYPDIKEDMFISMAYLILDAESRTVTLARAGHDAPLLYRAATGEVDRINPKGMALGIDSGEVFNRVCADFSFGLETGDCLLLYTDGATEALNRDGTEYGLPRLVQSLEGNAKSGAASVVQCVAEDVRSFAGNHPQHDDITLIAIART